MRDLSPGWATSLAILRHTGSSVQDRGDHLVVRTPQNPTFHWGNFLLVRGEDRVDDAAHWQAVFAGEFPDATWLAVGLPRPPGDPSGWAAVGAVVEQDEVLTTSLAPRLLPEPAGYRIRELATPDDWEQQVDRSLRENLASGEYEPVGHERFCRAEAAIRQDLCDRGLARWFAAFTAAGTLVADLGIVLCGNGSGGASGASDAAGEAGEAGEADGADGRPVVARYQSVGTDAAHRGRGLAGRMLGVAGAWAADRGARRWVIVTGVTNPAGRLYRSVGFGPDDGDVQAYRPPTT